MQKLQPRQPRLLDPCDLVDDGCRRHPGEPEQGADDQQSADRHQHGRTPAHPAKGRRRGEVGCCGRGQGAVLHCHGSAKSAARGGQADRERRRSALACPFRHLEIAQEKRGGKDHNGVVTRRLITMYQRILVPVDTSSTSQCGLREAIRLAADQKARLLILHVVDDFTTLVEVPSAGIYDELIRKLRQTGLDALAKARHQAEEASVHTETLLREVTGKRVAEVIVEQCKQHACDLVVMGTHGRTGLKHALLGSVAEKVVRHAPCPVLVVRSRTDAH
ncbi:MAG: universal stress protein [Ramlibacter sp.]